MIAFMLLFFPMELMADAKKFTVVIDAGHGGKDIGATDNGVMEKNINLKVAQHLESLIKKKMKNTNVVMTRDDDSFLSLQQRADKANKAQGDLFVSIHTNSVDKKNKNRKNISGSSVYTLGLHKDENNLEVAMRENSVIELENDYQQKYSGFDPQKDESYIIFEMAQKKNLSQSIKFAENIQKELVSSGRQDRGVHQAGFWVLWATSMPSVLIELDFICNPESAKYISSDKGAKELAESIFKAIQKYESNWNKNQKFVSSSDLKNNYTEGEGSKLEETYTTTSETTYALAKKRTQKRVLTQNTTQITKSDSRRRRSGHSKELSMSQSYESSKVKFPDTNLYAVAEASDLEEETSNKVSTSQDKESAKDKKAAKKREKEEKRKQEKEAKEAKKRRQDSHNAKVNKLVTVYKIQLLASTDLLNQNNARFCGLSPISTYKENNLYKYYYGESTDRTELETVLADVKKKIPDAFIVASKKTVQSDNKKTDK